MSETIRLNHTGIKPFEGSVQRPKLRRGQWRPGDGSLQIRQMRDPTRPVGIHQVPQIMVHKVHPGSRRFGAERDANPGVRLIRKFPGHAQPALRICLGDDAARDVSLAVVDDQGSAHGHLTLEGSPQPSGKELTVLEPGPDRHHGNGGNQEMARTPLSVESEVSGMGTKLARSRHTFGISSGGVATPWKR